MNRHNRKMMIARRPHPKLDRAWLDRFGIVDAWGGAIARKDRFVARIEVSGCRRFSILVAACLLMTVSAWGRRVIGAESVPVVVMPGSVGLQLVRISVPFARGELHEGESLAVRVGNSGPVAAGVRVLTWHPQASGESRSARRAMVTFPWRFGEMRPVEFRLRVEKADGLPRPSANLMPGEVTEDAVRIEMPGRDPLELRLNAPPGTRRQEPRRETVESHEFYRWERFHFDDPKWPRVIETRVDANGTVVVVAHLRRNDESGQFAPAIGWRMRIAAKGVNGNASGKAFAVSGNEWRHRFAEGQEAVCIFDDKLAVYHPAAAGRRRGGVELKQVQPGLWEYGYDRCTEEDRVPLQPMAWERAEIAITPQGQARLTASLNSPHAAKIEPKRWAVVYGDLHELPEMPAVLEDLVKYHCDAVVRSAAVGDDF